MPAPVYIGDEVSAAGFRLAGLRVLAPPADAVVQALEQLPHETPLVLLDARLARQIPARILDGLLAGFAPRIVIVPAVYGDAGLPDLTSRIRRQLGVLE